jgi:hypothetical protein
LLTRSRSEGPGFSGTPLDCKTIYLDKAQFV